MSLHGLTVCDVAREEWDAVTGCFADLSFEQTLAYSAAASARIGGVTRLLSVQQSGVAIAAAAVRLKRIPGTGRGIAWIPSGPLVCRRDRPPPEPEAVADLLSAIARQVVAREGSILRLRLSAASFRNAAEPQVLDLCPMFAASGKSPSYRSSLIDLGKTEDQLMRGLDGKWRTDLRAAGKASLTLERQDGAAISSRFDAMFASLRIKKGFRPDVLPEFHYALAGPAYRLDTLIAMKDGRDVAGIVIGTAGSTATYLFGATTDEGRASRAGYFLTWHGIILAKQRGAAWYDLGGIDATANPDVARFKQRMNGIEVLSQPVEARPPGPFPALVDTLEAGRHFLKNAFKVIRQ